MVFALIVATLIYFYEDAYRLITNRAELEGWLSRQGPYAPLLFILLQAVQVVAAPIPGEVTGVVGGYLYGALWGSLYSTVGLTIGSAIAFALAHAFGEPLLEWVIKKDILVRYNHFVERNVLALAFVFFIIPGFPKDALCYVLGLSKIRFLPFLAVCMLGRLLGTVGLSISGAVLRDFGNFSFTMIFSLIVIVALLFVIFLFKKRLLAWLQQRKRP